MSLSQQKRLYEAERCLWGHGREFSNLSEATNYLNAIIESEWFIKLHGYLPSILVIHANIGRWAGAADRKGFKIYLNRRNEHVLLHELSHLLASTDEHNEEFVWIFLNLVRNACGFYAWAEFCYELKKAGYWDVI